MKEKTKKTQEQMIMEWLEAGKGLSQRDAVGFGCYRLSGRVFDLRAKGIPIVTIMKHDKVSGANYAEYRLEAE